jgi:hypothetical protein
MLSSLNDKRGDLIFHLKARKYSSNMPITNNYNRKTILNLTKTARPLMPSGRKTYVLMHVQAAVFSYNH